MRSASTRKLIVKSKKLPVSWIVVVRANLDDVIIGSFPFVQQAMAFARLAMNDPEKAQSESHPEDRWDSSGVIAVAVYRAQGSKVSHHWQEDPQYRAA